MVNKFLFLLLVFAICPGSISGKLRVSGLFADNMVIQRGEPITIQGIADPREVIRVTFRASALSCQADRCGKWRVELPAEEAGGPYTLSIQTAREKLVFENILIGEVWLASGQSNMEHPMEGWGWMPHSGIYRYKEELNDSHYPEIRLFSVPKYPASVEIDELPERTWKVADPESVRTFSSIAWFFAKELHERLGVPVGIINCSWSGTSIHTWESEEILRQFKDSLGYTGPTLIPERTKVMDDFQANLRRRHQISYPRPGQIEEIRQLPPEKWSAIELDSLRSTASNIIWLKREIDLPDDIAKEPLALSLGRLNGQSYIYLNGREIDEFSYPEPVVTRIPRYYIYPGKNELIVRVARPFGAPSAEGKESSFFISAYDSSRYKEELADNWKITIQDAVPTPLPEYQNKPGALFNGMVHPCLSHNIKGIIWYQGENDIWRADLYAQMFEALIEDWRGKWGKKDMPFLYVQISLIPLPEFGDHSIQERFREKQHVSSPHTGMVYSLDIGDPYDVHPKEKKTIGKRLAEQALKIAYKPDH